MDSNDHKSSEKQHDPLYPSISSAHSDVPTSKLADETTECHGFDEIMTIVEKGEPDPTEPPNLDGRESWGKSMDFLMSIIGFSVDLANVWRFPFLCYKNGGGAFLVPYFLITIFGALPLFFMELALGQYNRQGPITIWKMCPLFKGIGYCAVLVSYFVSFYYNVIIAWSFFYVYGSFNSILPWTHCDNPWNTALCWNGTNSGEVRLNFTDRKTPSEEYFNNRVLGMQSSEGFDELGFPDFGLVLCGVITYAILYLSLFKGVKSLGKVIWVTAIMPYGILTVLLVRGAMLPGAKTGIMYYLTPSVSALMNPQVWYEAANQVFFSVGAGIGVHLSYASYNKFHHNFYRDCLITAFVNAFTSFYSGLVIFMYLGYMSFNQETSISEVATGGAGLVFQVYPEAIATLPGAQVWSVLFFLMLIMLGLDSGMGGLECVITGLSDELKEIYKEKVFSRETFTAIILGISFIISLTSFCQGGMYVFHWFDTYASGISLLTSALMEAIAISWFYGLPKFSNDIEEMLGFRPSLYWRICWKFVSPFLVFVCVMIGVVSLASERLVYPGLYFVYVYPLLAIGLGWILALTSISMIPLWMGIGIFKSGGRTIKQKLILSITPVSEQRAIMEGSESSRARWRHWISF